MSVLGIRFCSVLPTETARAFIDHLGSKGWGFPERDPGEMGATFTGGVYPAGEASWIEAWGADMGMPEGTMLHVVVDDADAYAQTARTNGVAVEGPMDAHGERIYSCEAPGGLKIAVLSKLPD